jgi:biotin carboxylase
MKGMQAILILDPVIEWLPLVKTAKEQNMVVVFVHLSPIPDRLVRFMPTESDFLDSGADFHVIELRNRDCFECVRVVQLLLRKEDLILQAVIPLSETAVDYSDIIAAMLNLPFHNPLSLVTTRRDKGLMKEVVLQFGIRVAKFTRIHTCHEVELFMEQQRLNFPIVIKTPQGFSTTDVFICADIQEVTSALKRILGRIGPDGRVVSDALVEEYIDGTEFAVNMMAFQGNVTITDVWKYVKTDNARYCQADICNPNSAELIHVIEYCRKVSCAVGIHYGAAHVEVKAELNDDGVYVDPCMIEIGARLSGGRKATMTQASLDGNWNPFAALIDIYSGILPSFPDDFIPKQFVRHIFLPIEKSGRVDNISFDTSILKTLHSYAMIVRKGDFVEETTDITSSAGFIWLVGHKIDVEQDTELVFKHFSLTISSAI